MYLTRRKIAGIAAMTFGLAAIGLCSGIARADINPDSVTVTSTGTGKFLWDYSTDVSGTEQVLKGDYFTIYDFAGYVGVEGPLPTGWTYTTELISAPVVANNSTASVVDDPNLLNVTFTYEGTTALASSNSLLSKALGDFTIESLYGDNGGTSSFAALAHSKTHVSHSTKFIQNENSTTVETPSVAPEPGAVAFGGFVGMSMLGLVVSARRKKSSIAPMAMMAQAA